ncbi:MAG: hypothetical protein CFE33_02985 [Pseudorhodobacter sp. PARRP1]|nr:MAG: hypothetical protein CFE33_02985 [Pseudorhodobacter sp. PARRP1]
MRGIYAFAALQARVEAVDVWRSLADLAGVERRSRASGGGFAPDADLGFGRLEAGEPSGLNFALAAFQIIETDSAVEVFKFCLVAGFATRQQFKELGHGVYSVVPSLPVICCVAALMCRYAISIAAMSLVHGYVHGFCSGLLHRRQAVPLRCGGLQDMRPLSPAVEIVAPQ